MWKGFIRGRRARLAAVITLVAVMVAVSSFTVVSYECNTNGALCLGQANDFPHEKILLDHYTFQTAPSQQFPTILTLWINNIGSSTVTLQSLYLLNSTSGATLFSTTLSSSIVPATMANVTINTSSSGFHFTTPQYYTVSLLTSRYKYGFSVNYP